MFTQLSKITIQLHGGAGHWRCPDCGHTGLWTEAQPETVHPEKDCARCRSGRQRKKSFSLESALRSGVGSGQGSKWPEYVAARAALEKPEVKVLLVLGVGGSMCASALAELLRIVLKKEGGKVVHVNPDTSTSLLKALF